MVRLFCGHDCTSGRRSRELACLITLSKMNHELLDFLFLSTKEKNPGSAFFVEFRWSFFAVQRELRQSLLDETVDSNGVARILLQGTGRSIFFSQ